MVHLSRLPLVPDYPFSAVVGQGLFKLALILAAINPAIGGVLISGLRGCAKSTLARGLADVLPEQPSFVTLPLGATEEMVVGTLNLQQVLNEREVAFSPGLLARAHGGVLYVDEVNLLSDPLVDLLLDVCASGINCIERDGISHHHASEFLLIGTMNPDEGELRPQLRDRFGLMVELDNQFSIAERMEIVRRREAFDFQSERFCESFADEQRALQGGIARARVNMRSIPCADSLRVEIAERCHAARVDGLRADIVWYRSALANAAWNGRSEVLLEDIDAVEPLVLAHRRNHFQAPKPPAQGQNAFSRPPSPREMETGSENQPKNNSHSGQWGAMAPRHQEMEKLESRDVLCKGTVKRTPNGHQRKSLPSQHSGDKSRGKACGAGKTGTTKKSAPDWFRTLLASAGHWPPAKICFRQARSSRLQLHLVLLDTSASTLKANLFGKAKGVVARIAEQAYLERHQLAIMGFGNDEVQTILTRRSRSPKDIRKHLEALPGGGGTPIRDVLLEARFYLQKLKRQEPDTRVHTYLLTDGRTSQQVADIQLTGTCTVIDLEQAVVKRGRASTLARELGATYLSLAALEPTLI